jgi:hypothetical protein
MGSTLSKEDGWREVQVRNLRSKIFLGDTQGEALCKEVGGGQVEDKFFGPQNAISPHGPKNSGIPGPNPLPLHLVMYMHASKTLCTGLYKS